MLLNRKPRGMSLERSADGETRDRTGAGSEQGGANRASNMARAVARMRGEHRRVHARPHRTAR